jgi:hypothetical protein
MKIESTIDLKQYATSAEATAIVNHEPKVFEAATKERALRIAKSAVLRCIARNLGEGYHDNLTEISFKVNELP